MRNLKPLHSFNLSKSDFDDVFAIKLMKFVDFATVYSLKLLATN
jgi:hypothetical protein